jgi:hypothetical protein
MRKFHFAVVLCSFVCGCTHFQLARNTSGQLSTVSTLYQKQVLDNLAMFMHDPGSLPYFSVLSSSNTQLQDTGNASGMLNFARVGMANLFMVSGETTSVGVMRVAQDSWNATPVTDPRRLELMRCAYQTAVAAAACQPGAIDTVSSICPDCNQRWKAFYGVKRDGALDDQGRVTNLCLRSEEQWFGFGKKCDLPKHCDCLMIGEYCGLYVWVLPGHREQLSRLTLAILDYAFNQPAAVLTKDITFNIGIDGKLSTAANAVRTVKATIPINTPSAYVLDNEVATGHQGELHSMLGLSPPTPSQAAPLPLYYSQPYQNPTPPDFQYFNQRLQLLNPIVH